MANLKCTSPKHQEADCRVKYSVTHLKFTYGKWCDNCKAQFINQRKEFGEDDRLPVRRTRVRKLRV